MRERLDKTDVVRGMRESYDKWMDSLDGKLLFLNQQVKEGVASMSSPETASLQDIFKAMATKVEHHSTLRDFFTIYYILTINFPKRRTSTGMPRRTQC